MPKKIKEKKIEKIIRIDTTRVVSGGIFSGYENIVTTESIKMLADKINEIIDYLNSHKI